MKWLVLAIMLAWLGVCIPQSIHIWAAIKHEPGSFDYNMAIGRAILLDVMPMLTMWIGGMLASAHYTIADKAYEKASRRWAKQYKQGMNPEPLPKLEAFIDDYPSVARGLVKWVPIMFVALVLVNTVSYFAYYIEYDKNLALYTLVWFNFSIGVYIFRPVVFLARTVVPGLISWGLGRFAAVVHLEDIANDVAAVAKWVWELPVTLGLLTREPRVQLAKQPASPTVGDTIDYAAALKEFYAADPEGDMKVLASQIGTSYETLRRHRNKLLESDPTFVKEGRGRYIVKGIDIQGDTAIEDVGNTEAIDFTKPGEQKVPPKYARGD